MSNINYEEFLKISTEVELTILCKEIDTILIVNSFDMYDYDKDTCREKVVELLKLTYKVSDIKQKAIAYNAPNVVEACEAKINQIGEQMETLRDRYLY